MDDAPDFLVPDLKAAPCRVCGWLSNGGPLRLCVSCQDVHDWAAINRAFCNVLHRQAPLPWYGGDRTVVLQVARGIA